MPKADLGRLSFNVWQLIVPQDSDFNIGGGGLRFRRPQSPFFVTGGRFFPSYRGPRPLAG